MRAQEQPIERIVYHDVGLAVIAETAPKQLHSRTERFQAPRADRSVAFVRKKDAKYQKSWAGIVAGSKPSADIVTKTIG